MLLAGDTGSPAEDTQARQQQEEEVEGSVLGVGSREVLERRCACRFTHYGEAGSGKKGPEGGQSATQCPSVSDSAVSSGKLSGRVSYVDVAKGTVALNAGLTGHERCK